MGAHVTVREWYWHLLQTTITSPDLRAKAKVAKCLLHLENMYIYFVYDIYLCKKKKYLHFGSFLEPSSCSPFRAKEGCVEILHQVLNEAEKF